MNTRRNLFYATLMCCAAAVVVAFAQSASPIMRSRVFQWSEMPVAETRTGERRQVFDAPVATLERFESHVTTLNPGEAAHAPHRHPEEEMMILIEGTVEAVLNGSTNRVEKGGMIFCASNELHGLRNVGTNKATYYVIKWFPHDLAKRASAQ